MEVRLARLARVCTLPILLFGLHGCFYVSRSDYDEQWDLDGDGWPITDDGPSDCAPEDPNIYPGAPDTRGDGCDSDCGLERDADGDDWPDAADCGPNDPTRYPCADDVEGDGIDHDCDGLDGPRTVGCPVGETTLVPLDASCANPVGAPG